jgi:hypothetical protein
LTNYRSFEDAEFTLEPLTVFIGPVGGGKSNVFRALAWLQQALRRKPAEMFGPYPYDFWSHRYRGASTSSAGIAIEVTVGGLAEFPGEDADYRLEVAAAAGEPVIAHERLTRRSAGGALDLFDRRGGEESHGAFGEAGPGGGALLALAPGRAAQPTLREAVDAYRALTFAAVVARSLGSTQYYHLEPS